MLFQGDRSIMLAGSESSAYHLKRFMTLNKDVCIEIAGHINLPNRPDAPKESGYFELSVARALMIKDELIRFGVDTNRMVVKGYANWQMNHSLGRLSKIHQS